MTVTTFASVIGRTLFKSWLTNVGVEIMLDIPIKPLVFYFFMLAILRKTIQLYATPSF